MQTIARRAPGKNPTTIQSHSSQSTKKGSEKDNNLRSTKSTTTLLSQKQVGGSTKSCGETCRQLRQDRGPTCKQLRHHRQRGTKPSGRRAIGIHNILQALTTVQIFLRVRTGFGLLGEKTYGLCEQYTHKYSTYRVAQHDHISSREDALFKIKDCTSLCP